ncbi:twin transmembrane helix small protein [Marivivens marinus]|uniref:twin transmembrane helix small protein n=1 Tax=Marivivens marinus TaxID=3110173 RepID=UPI003B84A393
MLQDPLFIVVALSCLLVAGILLWGIGSFSKGGEYNKRNANKIMRYRIAAQFVAVLLILLFVWMRSGGQ